MLAALAATPMFGCDGPPDEVAPPDAAADSAQDRPVDAGADRDGPAGESADSVDALVDVPVETPSDDGGDSDTAPDVPVDADAGAGDAGADSSEAPRTCPVSTALPDLWVSEPHLTASKRFEKLTIEPWSCELKDACVKAAGTRRVLRFDMVIPNAGPGELCMGAPPEKPAGGSGDGSADGATEDATKDAPDAAADGGGGTDGGIDHGPWVWDACHRHFHYDGLAIFRLVDAENKVVVVSDKRAVCVGDDVLLDLAGDPESKKYSCAFQGLTVGWADYYRASLPCQFLDVTDVPPGDYFIEIEVNPDRVIKETNYDNNVGRTPITITASGVDGGADAGAEVGGAEAGGG